MQTSREEGPDQNPSKDRVLVVADWSLDPRAVTDSVAANCSRSAPELGILVPARLAGLQWIGDSTGSRPCAERQLATLVELAEASGRPVSMAQVGDPERVNAAVEALALWPASRIFFFQDGPRSWSRLPWGASRRLQRRSGLVVMALEAPTAQGSRSLGRWPSRRNRCCIAPTAGSVRSST